MKFILNTADFADWHGLYELLVDCFSYMDGKIDPPSSLHKMTEQSLKTKADKENLLVVYDDDRIVACAYFDQRPEVVYVGKVAVTDSHRKQGIANQIFDHAAQFAQNNGIAFLELETRIELTNNHQAFAKMGFEITQYNSHQGYSMSTSVTMRKAV
ncbi:MAG: GNAT family N-acetyltransferase [Hyphomicrobiales bacterium]